MSMCNLKNLTNHLFETGLNLRTPLYVTCYITVTYRRFGYRGSKKYSEFEKYSESMKYPN